jgi:hypothetical protein
MIEILSEQNQLPQVKVGDKPGKIPQFISASPFRSVSDLPRTDLEDQVV